MNTEIKELRSMVNETRTVINQVVEAQNSARDDASILSTRSNIPATVTTQQMLAVQRELATIRTTLAASEAREVRHLANPPG